MLEGRVALITGGTKGIGRAIAAALHQEGATVAVNGRDEASGEMATKELGEGAVFLQGDVTDRVVVDGLVDATVERFGRLDILVNNAGGATSFAPIAQMDDLTWQHCMDWTLNSAFWASRRALASMIPAGWGRIVNISSIEGKHGKPGIVQYVTAKHALNGFTKGLSKEVSRLGITVNAICPGLVITELVQNQAAQAATAMGATAQELLDQFAQEAATGRPTTVGEVAAMALLLVSEAGAGITGALLSVDGGTAAY